jgi:hypothetical protein
MIIQTSKQTESQTQNWNEEEFCVTNYNYSVHERDMTTTVQIVFFEENAITICISLICLLQNASFDDMSWFFCFYYKYICDQYCHTNFINKLSCLIKNRCYSC